MSSRYAELLISSLKRYLTKKLFELHARTIKIFHNQAIGERNRLNGKLSRASSINWFNQVELQRLYFFGLLFGNVTVRHLDHTEVHK